MDCRGPKCIGRMTQNNINPVNNNAINKDKYTNVNNVSNLLRSIRRILKLRNPEEKKLNFFGHMVPLRVHGHIYGQIIGGPGPPCCIIGGASAPPAPPPGSYSTAHRFKVCSIYVCTYVHMYIPYYYKVFCVR